MNKKSVLDAIGSVDQRISGSQWQLEGYFEEEAPSVFYLTQTSDTELLVPIDLFNSDLTPLQVIIKYAKESSKLSNAQIALLIGRDAKTIWSIYKVVKDVILSSALEDSPTIPISFFRDDTLSALECLVYYLKGHGSNFAQIGRAIGRNQRTVWTAYNRAQNKMKKRNLNNE